MAVIFANAGEVNLTDKLFRNNAGENLTLKLFKTDVTPSATSVAGDFTEADFSGYSAKTLSNGSWVAASSSGGKGTTSYAQQTFTASSAQTIYGFYVVGASSGTLIFAEKFDSAVVLGSGATLSLTLTTTLNSEA